MVISSIIMDTVGSGRLSWLESVGSIIPGLSYGLSDFQGEFSEDLSVSSVSSVEPSGRWYWIMGN